jgi:hypothetical protein
VLLAGASVLRRRPGVPHTWQEVAAESARMGLWDGQPVELQFALYSYTAPHPTERYGRHNWTHLGDLGIKAVGEHPRRFVYTGHASESEPVPEESAVSMKVTFTLDPTDLDAIERAERSLAALRAEFHTTVS